MSGMPLVTLEYEVHGKVLATGVACDRLPYRGAV
jgi:hypothetical protein